MVFPVYCIRDVKVGYAAPYIQSNNEAAQRDFSYRLHNNDVLGFSPSDYSLYRIGTFDSDSGRLTPEDPEFVVEGSAVF